MKRVLITGAGSYIGGNIEDYLRKYPEEYRVEVLDVKGEGWFSFPFSGVDVVINVAGIAHMRERKENEDLYYKVNRDLAIEIAGKSKAAGVGKFILLSSMSVYGKATGLITKNTVPAPKSYYGESKLEADMEILKMESPDFKVVILRPPMVYGKGCKGNYRLLRKIALHSPVFPEMHNRRSMLFIGNLCCFVKRMIDKEEDGIFFPQNADYVDVCEMVKAIAGLNGKRIFCLRVFNPVINGMKHLRNSTFQKVFGDLLYENTDMVGDYDFHASMEITERHGQ